jgi:hypothetical protein
MNPFYILAFMCAAIIAVLFFVLPTSHALVYSLFPGAGVIIFLSIPGIADHFSDDGSSNGKASSGAPVGTVTLVVFVFLGLSYLAPPLALLFFIVVLALVCIRDYVVSRRE